MKYNRYYINGGGKKYDDGVVDIKFTKKTTIITQLIENKPIIYSSWLWNNKDIEIIRLKGLPKIDNDGSFVIYHKGAGTPFIYDLI